MKCNAIYTTTTTTTCTTQLVRRRILSGTRRRCVQCSANPVFSSSDILREIGRYVSDVFVPRAHCKRCSYNIDGITAADIRSARLVANPKTTMSTSLERRVAAVRGSTSRFLRPVGLRPGKQPVFRYFIFIYYVSTMDIVYRIKIYG